MGHHPSAWGWQEKAGEDSVMKRTISALVGGLLLLAAGAVPAVAAEAQLAYGVVDMVRVGKECPGIGAMQEESAQFAQEQQVKLYDRERVMMLADADYTRYFDLRLLAAPTEANTKQLADLERLAVDRMGRFRELTAIKDRTADQQKEYDELNKVYATRMGELSRFRAELQRAVDEQQAKLAKQTDAKVEAAAKAVAAEKKLSLVFVRAALIFGGTDVTDEMIAKLNAPAPAPAAPKATPAPTATAAPAATSAPATPGK